MVARSSVPNSWRRLLDRDAVLGAGLSIEATSGSAFGRPDRARQLAGTMPEPDHETVRQPPRIVVRLS